MNDDTAIIIGIAIVIIWQGFVLIQKQRELRRKMDILQQAEDDRNIDYSGYTGSGISYKRKHYPDLEIVDDHRQTVEEPKEDKLA